MPFLKNKCSNLNFGVDPNQKSDVISLLYATYHEKAAFLICTGPFERPAHYRQLHRP
jgi:hypothetical protein